jgi:hypothetical protein
VNSELNVAPAGGMLEPPITLESIRAAWLRFDATAKPGREDNLQEIEEYLRSSLFLISAIAHKLKGPTITIRDAKCLGEQLSKTLAVTEQSSLYLCERCHSVRT